MPTPSDSMEACRLKDSVSRIAEVGGLILLCVTFLNRWATVPERVQDCTHFLPKATLLSLALHSHVHIVKWQIF